MTFKEFLRLATEYVEKNPSEGEMEVREYSIYCQDSDPITELPDFTGNTYLRIGD